MATGERSLSGAMAIVWCDGWFEAAALEKNVFGGGIVLQGRWRDDDAGRAECLRRCAGVSVERVGVFVSRDLFLLRRIGLPAATRENLATVLEYELERHFPVTPGSARWGYAIQGDDSQGHLDVLVALADAGQLNERLRPLETAGIPVDAAAPLTPLLARFFAASGGDQADIIAIPDGASCEVALVAKGCVLASRPVSLAGTAAWEHLSRAVQELAARHAGELSERGVNRFFWIAHTPVPVALEGVILSDLGARCLSANAWTPLLRPANAGADTPVPEAPLALALATALLDCACPSTDVLRKPARRKPRRYDLAVAVALAALLAVGLAVSYVRGLWVLSAQRDRLKIEVESLRDTVARISQDEKDLFDTLDKLRRRQKVIDNRKRVLAALADLSTLMDENTYLTTLNLSDGNMTISGVSADPFVMVQPLLGSPYFKVEDVPTVQPPKGFALNRIRITGGAQ